MKKRSKQSGEFRELEKKSGRSWKNQGVLTGSLNIKVLTLLRSNLTFSVSAKMLYQEVMENSLRSRRSEGNVSEN